jgi:hypothetical protein
MCSVESSVKQQFARVFRESDWRLFKKMADCYFRQAAFLLKHHLGVPPDLKLLVRNSQKRLFIGVGTELILKALYLKNGYAVNRPEDGNKTLKFPFTLKEVAGQQLLEDETFLLGMLIDHLGKVISLNDRETILKGLKIAKVFRNKEGHVVTSRHTFDLSNYRNIESALRELYRTGFEETLKVQFSLAPNEKPVWQLTHETQSESASSQDRIRRPPGRVSA